MDVQYSIRRNHALTLFEVLVVIAIVLMLAAVLLPTLAKDRRKSSKIGCVNNLKQLGLAYRIWGGDNGDLYPMRVPVANGGAMESAATDDVVAVFQVMTNELSTPKILICPDDLNHDAATNFSSFVATNISYLVGINADTNYSPNLILSGDANLTLAGRPVKSGLLDVAAGAPVGWEANRHSYGGNIGLNDGSVQSMTRSGLMSCLSSTGLATNRLVIP